MDLELKDELLIQYGDMILKAIPANGLDNINNKEETIKVIFEKDNSYNPKTINIKDIISINGKAFEGEEHVRR